MSEAGNEGGNAGGDAKRFSSTALFIGAVVAVAVIAIGAGLVYYLTSQSSDDAGDAGASVPTSNKSTTTTVPGSTTTTGAAGTTTTTAAGGATPGGVTAATTPPTPRATADPEDAPYQPQPLPAGVGATLTSCRWDPGNGGQLVATGTITSATEDDVWFVTAYWLQNDRELDSQDDIFDFEAAGQTKPWTLTTAAPMPPADLRCAVEVS